MTSHHQEGTHHQSCRPEQSLKVIYLLSKDEVMTDIELKGAEVAAKFLAKQMQQ